MDMNWPFHLSSNKSLYEKKFLATGLFITIISIFYLSNLTKKSLSHSQAPDSSVFKYPLCTEDILSKGTPLYLKDHLPLLNQNGGHCRLHFYSQADIVTCFDNLNSSNNDEQHKLSNTTATKNIHIAFIGDSRIRQIFGNVIQFLPDLEDHSPKLGIATKSVPRIAHDLHVEAPLLRASLTFNWTIVLEDKFVNIINHWIDSRNEAPNYLVIGTAFHHMAFSYNRKEANRSNFEWPNGFRYSHKTYENNIIRVWPLLDQLSKKKGVKIVWWSQDVAAHPPINNAKIAYHGINKVLGYNEIARRIFKSNKVPLEIWDSTNKMYMEFNRMCEFAFQRDSPHNNTRNSGLFVTSWSRCYEVQHPSQSHNIISAQLLINDICNKVIEKELSRR